MAIATGRKGETTARDARILKDLFFADWLTVDHIALVHFHNVEAKYRRKTAHNRLLRLKGKGLVHSAVRPAADAQAETRTTTFFYLSREARVRVGSGLHREALNNERLFARGATLGRNNPEVAGIEPPDETRADHAERVGALYLSCKGVLVKKLGPPGAFTWYWRNERRALRPYRHGDDRETSYYKPDAELIFFPPIPEGAPLGFRPPAFHVFFEYQTAASHASSLILEEKVRGHAFASYNADFPPPAQRLLYFCAETDANIAAADKACDSLGVPGGASNLSDLDGELSALIDHVLAQAREDTAA